MRRILAGVILLCLLFAICGCSESRYQETDFLGKSSAEIVDAFGDFDCVGRNADSDGLYRNTSCGYIIEESQKGFFGTDSERLFFISFDENGIAYRCYEGYRPGG